MSGFTNPKSMIQDLREFLNKRRENPLVSYCHYEQLILAVFSHCHCITYTRPSVFNRLKLSLTQSSTRRQRDVKQEFSEPEYPDISFNIVAPEENSRKENHTQNSNSSDSEYSTSLKNSSDLEYSTSLKRCLMNHEVFFRILESRTEH